MLHFLFFYRDIMLEFVFHIYLSFFIFKFSLSILDLLIPILRALFSLSLQDVPQDMMTGFKCVLGFGPTLRSKVFSKIASCTFISDISRLSTYCSLYFGCLF